MQRRIILALLVLIVIAIGFFALNNRQFSGFFSLSERNNLDKGQVQESNDTKETETALGADLSFGILKKSLISAELFLKGRIPKCPETTDANILVKNNGNEKIEAMKITAALQLQIKACSGCILNTIDIGEAKKIQLKLCNASEETPLIIVSSANTEQVEIRIDKNG